MQAAHAQIITPISFSGGNANLVYDFGPGTYQGSSDNVNAPVVGVDGNYAFAAANSGYVGALPADLVIPAGRDSYQLGALSTNAGVRLGRGYVSTDTLTLNTPQAYSSIGFLATGGDGGGLVSYTLNFADSSTQTGTFNVPDWYSGGGTDNSSDTYFLVGQLPLGNNTEIPVRFYDFTADITSTSALTSVEFSYSGGNEIGLFAMSGTPEVSAVPEPSTYALLLSGGLFLVVLRMRRQRLSA
jgi:hypothetical protein